MSVIVTDEGFGRGDWTEADTALDLASDCDPATLAGQLEGIERIRVDFPSVADGRGFTIARQLRLMGYTGRLRARGHIIADQYAMARRAGFDEVAIDANHAARQDEAQWLARANWRDGDYRRALGSGPPHHAAG